MSKPVQFRSDLLTDLLLEALQNETGDNRTVIIKKAIYQYAEKNLTVDEMQDAIKFVADQRGF